MSSAAPPAPSSPALPTSRVLAEAGGCGLAVVGQYIYYLAPAENGQGGTPARIPKIGGSPELLAPNVYWVSDFAVDEPFVYYLDSVTDDVRALSMSDRRVTTLAPGPQGVAPFPSAADGLAIDAGNVYWNDGAYVMAVSKRGKGVRWLGGVRATRVFDVDERFIYFADGGTLWRAAHGGDVPSPKPSPRPDRPGERPKTPLPAERLTQKSDHSAHAIRTDASHVYWLEQNALWRTSKADAKEERLATLPAGLEVRWNSGQRLALDATSVYALAGKVVGQGSDAREVLTDVVKSPKQGGPVRIVASAHDACAVAADGDAVYVATRHVEQRGRRIGSLLRFELPPR